MARQRRTVDRQDAITHLVAEHEIRRRGINIPGAGLAPKAPTEVPT